MRILITGAKGQLGRELLRILSQGSSQIGPIPDAYAHAEMDGVDLDELDISDAGQVDAWFAAHGPYDLVINGAAYTNVDGCEANPGPSFAANALGPMNLARACARMEAKLVHVSTDYVFPGTDASPRVEEDVPRPLSAYGRTKLAGEGLALSANPRTFVVRTAWLYGEGHNFVQTMLGLGRRLPSVTVVDDQLGNPTSANDLAHEILRIAATEEYGIYHATCEGTCSWADFAEAIMLGAGLECEVLRCTSDEYAAAHPDAARRPAFSALENARLKRGIGTQMRTWQDALDAYLSIQKTIG